jgi:hypothetical protein
LIEKVRNHKIGYVGYSSDLQHPADRRRLGSWAAQKGAPLLTNNPLESDLLVITNAANFGFWLARAEQPVVLDLVDGYLGENPGFMRDFFRNLIRTFGGTSSLKWLTYTRHLKFACKMSTAVVVASIEQKKALEKYNSNVWVIEDDHHEIELEKQVQNHIDRTPTNYIFWEGLGYTLKHFETISKDLDKFLLERDWGMYLVTVEEYKRWGGIVGKVRTTGQVKKMFPLSHNKISIIPWSLHNLVRYAKLSKFAIIPIDVSDRFAMLKSENKLLSMWHLGLPTLCSSTPAYLRMERDLKSIKFCVDARDWDKSLIKFASKRNITSFENTSLKKYVELVHTHVHITSKWDALLENVLASKKRIR